VGSEFHLGQEAELDPEVHQGAALELAQLGRLLEQALHRVTTKGKLQGRVGQHPELVGISWSQQHTLYDTENTKLSEHSFAVQMRVSAPVGLGAALPQEKLHGLLRAAILSSVEASSARGLQMRAMVSPRSAALHWTTQPQHVEVSQAGHHVVLVSPCEVSPQVPCHSVAFSHQQNPLLTMQLFVFPLARSLETWASSPADHSATLRTNSMETCRRLQPDPSRISLSKPLP